MALMSKKRLLLNIDIFFAVVLWNCVLSFEGFTQDFKWLKTTSKPAGQFFFNSEVRGDSKCILLVTDLNTNNKGHVWLVDTSGSLVWEKQFLIPGFQEFIPRSIDKIKETENFFVVGTGDDTMGGHQTIYCLIDSSANLIYWNSINFPGLQGGTDGLVLPDGSYLVLGGKFNVDADMFISRVDQSGVLWTKEFTNPGIESGQQIVDLYNGRFLVLAKQGKNAFSIEIDKEGNFHNFQFLDTGSFEVRSIRGSNSLNGGIYYSAFIKIPVNTFQTRFYSLNNSSIESKFDLAFPTTNSFEINQDSNFIFFLFDGNQDGIGLYQDSTKLSDDYIPDDGISRGFSKLSLLGNGDGLAFGSSFDQGDFDICISKFSGLGTKWEQDPCLLAKPMAGIIWDYQFPALTLLDTSYAGMEYLDTIFHREWYTSFGDTSSMESFVTFWDTTGQTSVDLTLVIENWYGCRDTLNQTLSFWPNQISSSMAEKLPIKMFPNPARNIVNVWITQKPENGLVGIISIIDLKGRELLSKGLDGQKTQLDLSDINPGLYVAKIRINGSTQFKKFLVQR